MRVVSLNPVHGRRSFLFPRSALAWSQHPALSTTIIAPIPSTLSRPYSSCSSLLPKKYANPPPTTLAAHNPNVAPLTKPLAPNLLEKACFRRLATTRYAALQADVTPAESVGKPLTFKYEEKRRTGGKSMGRAWKGRKCCAVISVARAVGGTEDSEMVLVEGR